MASQVDDNRNKVPPNEDDDLTSVTFAQSEAKSLFGVKIDKSG